MIMAVGLFNAAYPAVVDSSQAINNMAARSEDRLQSQIEIIHVAAELDSDGWWQDTDGNGYFDVFVWVKNIGSTRIYPVESLDVFFGSEGSFVRIPHANYAGGTYPRWSGRIENGSDWTPTGTLRIAISYSYPQPSGRYYVKVTAPNGVSDETYTGW
jgi:hypothetical protein